MLFCQWGRLLSSLLLENLICDIASEGCPPYLDATAEDREACNLGSQEYLSGTWKRREEDCQVAEEEALKELSSGCQDRIGAIADWYWQPASCNLRRFDAQQFDRLLANKTLLIVGDSLAAQQYESLKMLLELVVAWYNGGGLVQRWWQGQRRKESGVPVSKTGRRIPAAF